MRGLLVLSLASAAGVAGAAGAWSQTLSIQVRMNSWKRSFGGAIGAGAGAGPGAGASGPRAGRLMAGLPRRAGGIVDNRERRRSEEQRAERRVTSLAFQTGWLNRCESF